MENPIGDIELTGLPLFKKGKVRNVYEVGDKLLIVATDRISAFDWVLPSLIPYKGKVLTQLSKFWFDLRRPGPAQPPPGHARPRISRPSSPPFAGILAKRSMLVKKTKVVPIECVVRGYLSGSGWKEYKTTGQDLRHQDPQGPPGVRPLAEPIFTPSTKAEQGHDVNISFKDVEKDDRRGPGPEDPQGQPRALPEGRPLRRLQGHHHRRHEVRVRPRRRRARPHRRDLHPRLLALLAAVPLRAGQVPAQPGQAVRPRLPRDDELGQESRPAGPARGDRRQDVPEIPGNLQGS